MLLSFSFTMACIIMLLLVVLFKIYLLFFASILDFTQRFRNLRCFVVNMNRPHCYHHHHSYHPPHPHHHYHQHHAHHHHQHHPPHPHHHHHHLFSCILVGKQGLNWAVTH